MSKELDKFKKTYKPLSKSADSLLADYKSHGTNLQHHRDMLFEAANEIGRVVQTLKDAGKTGTELKDFENEKEMSTVMKTVLDIFAALSKEETRFKTISKDAPKVTDGLKTLRAAIDAEVTSREKKANRKIAAVDSKSLPDMKKLSVEVAAKYQRMKDDVIDDIQDWSKDGMRKLFERTCKTEIAKSKADRNARDTGETDAQAFNIRQVKKHVAEFKSQVDAARDGCATAEKHFKNREVDEGDAAITAARTAYDSLGKILEPYRRRISGLNKYDLQIMKDNKDGKWVLENVEAMERAVEGVSKLIKKTSRMATI